MSRSDTPQGGGQSPGRDHEQLRDDASYEVGYGKPPRHSRFGRGNKMGRGRRKGSRNLATIFKEQMDAKVEVKADGRRQRISKRELLVQQLVNLGAKGDLKAIARVLLLEERYGPREEASELSAEEQQRDREALADFLRLHGLNDESGDE